MKVPTPIRVRAGELRLGDVYVTRSRGITVKREVIGRRETIAGDATGDPQAAVELTCSDGTSPMLLREQIVEAERELRPLGGVTDDVVQERDGVTDVSTQRGERVPSAC